ncbi:pts system, fructose-specific iiabc component [Borreliella garinii Far04]|nr:pts system, fructose-specific iiabc component [Borreliella garinii Far04]
MQNLFSKNLIALNYNATSKEDVIRKMANMLNENGYLNDMEAFIKEIKEREEINGTGIEEHIAMPHAKVISLKTWNCYFKSCWQWI